MIDEGGREGVRGSKLLSYPATRECRFMRSLCAEIESDQSRTPHFVSLTHHMQHGTRRPARSFVELTVNVAALPRLPSAHVDRIVAVATSSHLRKQRRDIRVVIVIIVRFGSDRLALAFALALLAAALLAARHLALVAILAHVIEKVLDERRRVVVDEAANARVSERVVGELDRLELLDSEAAELDGHLLDQVGRQVERHEQLQLADTRREYEDLVARCCECLHVLDLVPC
mmetsp:Transcript_29049/g.74707  ORF Transcript_29049/g.74707 Transcript_29049/m.74707 type:complete len:231 (+) Transcript_29049:135-827(+)